MNDEEKIIAIVKSCYDKYDCIKIMKGNGTYEKPYQIIILDLAINVFEHTIVLEDREYNVMNVTALTRKISNSIHNAGFKNFKLYMVPQW